MTARQEAQQQLTAAIDMKKRLEFQRSQLNRRSPLYATRAGGIDMQIAQAVEFINTAQTALDTLEASGDNEPDGER